MDKLLVLTLTALIVLPRPVLASDGNLDTSFGIAGRVSSRSESANATAIQPDGKIVVAGSVLSTSPGAADFAIVRYNSNGSLDTTFGIRGRVTTDFSGRGDGALALAIQSDGRIVAAGWARNLYDNDFALARYNRNGSLDTTFGTAGKITTDVSGSGDAIYAIAIQADGKVVAAGEMRANPGPDSSPTGVIVRYNSDGSVDTGFGIDGKVTTDLPNGSTSMHAVAIQADGKIIAAEKFASSNRPSDYRGLLIRYNTDGSLDKTFGDGGKVTTDVFGLYYIVALALQSNGKIIAVGGLVARFNTDGSPDTIFNNGGTAFVDFGGFWGGSLFALALQSDGKIIVAGDSEEYGETMFALARFNRDGSLDATFGIGGIVKSGLGDRSSQIHSLGIQRDGKIVAAGHGFRHNLESPEFELSSELARFNTTGLLLVYDIRFDPGSTIGMGDSWTATLSGPNLTDETYFDLRFRSPGSDTDQVALNWQRGTTERHTILAGTTAGSWIITGVRAHLDISDHDCEFIPVSVTLTVSQNF